MKDDVCKYCGGSDFDSIDSQYKDCDNDYDDCTIIYCKKCKQTISITI